MSGGLIKISCHKSVSSKRIIRCQECNYQTCSLFATGFVVYSLTFKYSSNIP